MTQNDRDNGRLICLVGIAPHHPSEFVVFRIGQQTADSCGRRLSIERQQAVNVHSILLRAKE